MKKLILAAMLAVTPTMALAQQQPQSYTLTITEPMLNVIGKGLGELPFKDAAPVMQYLQQQVMISQQKAAVDAAKPKPDNKMGDIHNNKGIITQDNKPVEEKKTEEKKD